MEDFSASFIFEPRHIRLGEGMELLRKTVSIIMLALLLTSMLTLAFNVQPVKARTIVVPDDYPTIQQAINAASSGDTIFAHSGLYYENLVVNKSVSLIGEDKYTTIIDGNHTGDVVYVTANFVNISGFMIRNSGTDSQAGILVGRQWNLQSVGNNISGNTVINNYYGILLACSFNSTISNNNVTLNTFGIQDQSRDYDCDIWTMNADGSNQTLLTTREMWDDGPEWYPNHSKILFERVSNPFVEGPSWDIWAMNTDGTSQTQLTIDSKVNMLGGWSPDGSQIVYSSERTGNHDIWVMDSDGTNNRQLTNDPSMDTMPTYSPDGSKIIFISSRGGSQDMWVMNADGTNQTRLTSGIPLVVGGSWSPDGTRIVFHSVEGGQNGNWDMWVINSDGTNATKLFSSPFREAFPHWSPDGSRIAYGSDEAGSWDIWVMNADGTNRIRLTTEWDTEEICSWSADGTKLAFARAQWALPSYNKIILNSVCDNEQEGIRLQQAIGVTVDENWICHNGHGGLTLFQAPNNALRSNNITDNGLNFCVDGQANEDYINDVDESNTVNGKPIYYWINQSGRQVPTNAGCVLLVNCTNIRVEDLVVEHNGFGVELCATTNSTIRNVTASNNANGIYLYLSSGNTILNNTANSNQPQAGILLLNSKDNILRDNVMMQNQMDFGAAVLGPHVLEDWINDVDESNTVEGKPVYYWVDQHDRKVPSDGGLLYLIFCSAITVKDMDISNNLLGVCMIGTYNSTVENVNVQNCPGGFFLLGSSGNTITNNTATNGQSFVWNGMTIMASNGIGLLMSNDNTVTSNTISNMQDPAGPPTPQEGPPPPGVGIWLMGENNRVFHNNFVNNTHHAIATYSPSNMWDDGYPSGGNYWSNYAGEDLCGGPDQNITGSDGIGDTAYIIDSNNQDHYPLMKPYPWASHDVGITSVTTLKTIVGQGYNVSISIMVFNYGNYIENINITVYANTTMIGEINNIELSSRNFTIVQYTWNTSGFAKGNYTIKAYAWPVQGETYTADNTFSVGMLLVTIPGDINGDTYINIKDAVLLGVAFGSKQGDLNYNPNADINGDGYINIKDAVLQGAHFGEHWE